MRIDGRLEPLRRLDARAHGVVARLVCIGLLVVHVVQRPDVVAELRVAVRALDVGEVRAHEPLQAGRLRDREVLVGLIDPVDQLGIRLRPRGVDPDRVDVAPLRG